MLNIAIDLYTFIQTAFENYYLLNSICIRNLMMTDSNDVHTKIGSGIEIHHLAVGNFGKGCAHLPLHHLDWETHLLRGHTSVSFHHLTTLHKLQQSIEIEFQPISYTYDEFMYICAYTQEYHIPSPSLHLLCVCQGATSKHFLYKLS